MSGDAARTNANITVVTGSGDRGDADALSRGIHRELTRPIEIDGGSVRIDASIGVAVAVGADRDIDALLADADAALYDSKARSRSVPR